MAESDAAGSASTVCFPILLTKALPASRPVAVSVKNSSTLGCTFLSVLRFCPALLLVVAGAVRALSRHDGLHGILTRSQINILVQHGPRARARDEQEDIQHHERADQERAEPAASATADAPVG